MYYQYQTFDDAPGLVDSYAKLKAFRMPPLVGKSLLDVGCNEGYYCGVALRAGANRVVGVDSFPVAIERARKRFPTAEFILQTWDNLPEEQFDVILFASSMHYLPTEERIIATLTHLRQRMKDNGLLILEVGVALDNGQKLLEVARSDGTVHYPTWEMLVKLINRSGLVWRRVGLSELGDNMPRVVIHCRRIRPVALFVRGRSMSGKSYLSNSLGNYNYSRILSLDSTLELAFKNLYPAFSFDTRDWPATLIRAWPELGAQSVSAIAGFVVNEIVSRSESAASHNVPRQDPIIIDGFDPSNDEYEVLYAEVVSRLLALKFFVWNTALLTPSPADPWDMSESFIDCGGFLLPILRSATEAAIVDCSYQDGIVSCTIDEGNTKSEIAGVCVVVAGFGPVVQVEVNRSQDARKLFFSFAAEKLSEDLKGVAPPHQRQELAQMEVHFAAWTDAFEAFYLDRQYGGSAVFKN